MDLQYLGGTYVGGTAMVGVPQTPPYIASPDPGHDLPLNLSDPIACGFGVTAAVLCMGAAVHRWWPHHY